MHAIIARHVAIVIYALGEIHKMGNPAKSQDSRSMSVRAEPGTAVTNPTTHQESKAWTTPPIRHRIPTTRIIIIPILR